MEFDDTVSIAAHLVAAWLKGADGAGSSLHVAGGNGQNKWYTFASRAGECLPRTRRCNASQASNEPFHGANGFFALVGEAQGCRADEHNAAVDTMDGFRLSTAILWRANVVLAGRR